MRQLARGPRTEVPGVSNASHAASPAKKPTADSVKQLRAKHEVPGVANASHAASPAKKPTAEGVKQLRAKLELPGIANASHAASPATKPTAEGVKQLRAKLEVPGVANASHAASSAKKPTAEGVKQLRAKLEAVLTGLQGMVNGRNGSLAKAKVAPAMTVFVRELERVLRNTSSIKDPSVAMAKLKDASAGLQTLVHELTARQEALMLEDEAQQESLLLGVLMSKQREPMERQRKVLQNPDFANLPVVKALLAANNTTSALYLQAARFLDEHRGSQAASALEGRAAEQAAAGEKLARSLEQRVKSMERELKTKEASYKRRAQLLTQRAESASSRKERHLAETLRRREERNFKKLSVIRSRDIASMRAAVEAVRRGDVKALQSTRAALVASLQALKSQNAGFLVLLSLGHRAMGRDCPYCAAQCIDKCRQVGNSYVKCLGDCAEAGKAF
uniref:Uncharacterized protein n=1 Tax=Alexandrium monilatum TaxID=311494 RepID=A0A7S4VS31_9DINO